MNDKIKAKRLGIFLCVVLIILFILLIIYLISSVFNIKDYQGELPTTKVITTTAINEGFTKLTDDKKYQLNVTLNDEVFVHSVENAISNNPNLKNVNLFESEAAKFKFIYTYLNYMQKNSQMTMDKINANVKLHFDTQLNSDNLKNYLKNNYYEYSIIKNEINYCYKAEEQKNKTLLVNKIKNANDICENNIYNYDESMILNQILIDYDIEGNNYVYYAYIIAN